MAELLTTREVAEELRLSTETVLRWAREGDLPAIRLSSGQIRFRRHEIDEWLAERSTKQQETEMNDQRDGVDPLLIRTRAVAHVERAELQEQQWKDLRRQVEDGTSQSPELILGTFEALARYAEEAAVTLRAVPLADSRLRVDVLKEQAAWLRAVLAGITYLEMFYTANPDWRPDEDDS